MPKKISIVPDTPSPANSESLVLSRRELLQTVGSGLAVLATPRDLWASLPEPDNTAALNASGFRYSPPWWQTAICLPDDSDKALVGKEGQLLFDFRVDSLGKSVENEGVGAQNFGILLQPDLIGGAQWVSQEMLSPRVPIIQTLRKAGGIEVSEQTFLVTPGAGNKVPAPRLARIDCPALMMYGWCTPVRESSPAFANGAISVGAPLHFQLAVSPGAVVTVVFGLCEGYFTESGKRLLTLSAEGSTSRTVDPVMDFGFNHPGIYKLIAHDSNKDGVIDIYIGGRAGSPKVPVVLNALWAFSAAAPSDDDIIAGRADEFALASFPANLEPSRQTVVLMTLKNSSAVAVTCQPVLHIVSVRSEALKESDGVVHVGIGTRVSGSAPLTLQQGNEGQFAAQMAAVTLLPGELHELVFTVDRHSSGSAGRLRPDQARDLCRAAQQWWGQCDLPYSAVTVPDRSIQDILESCVRNIWQARELKIGGPAFQVGPTCYRGLWIVDGSFLLESAAMLGRGLEARGGIEYLLSLQKPDGSFEIMPTYWKENGIVLWAATRHAFLTQDKEWLQRYWPALQRVVGAIQRMRESVSKNSQVLNYRLMPGGLVDGGINNTKEGDPEYSTVYWTLAGMKAFIGAARWLGDARSVLSCTKEYEEFYAAFREACARDVRRDSQGNAYVPVIMGNVKKYAPQKGQWAFCHAVYPGQIFPQDDPLIGGQLAMLRATEVEGVVCDTGWVAGGIWSYFASFYGHAQLWTGQGRQAAESLYAFAQHACPTRVWREEQGQLDQPPKKADMGGDMPHNWASAEFIRLATHLIELDRGDELHLLEGFPPEWASPGMVTRLDGVLTPFGPLHLEIRVADDGRSASVKMKQLTGRRPARLALHLGLWAGRNEVVELATDRDIAKTFMLSMASHNGGGRNA